MPTTVSTPASDLAIYCQRWQALHNTLDELYKHHAGLPDFPRKPTILYLLKSLHAFGAGQFHCFYYGFNDAGRDPKKDARLEPSNKYPPPYVLETILLQIGYDMEVIQRAADQRINGSDNIKKALARGDKLAWDAVKPAVDYRAVGERTTVLTYLQKSSDVRVIPYAQVALIGIPYSCTDCNRDFLAIPHEVGHYVFRHPSATARALQNEARPKLALMRDYHQLAEAWFEEIFADVYGCLVAGPVMALDFQSLQLQHSRTRFTVGDGTHPTPVLRPRIYTRVLQKAGQAKLTPTNWAKIARKLDDSWSKCVREREPKDEIAVSSTAKKDTGGKSVETTTTTRVLVAQVISGADSTATKPLDKAVDHVADIVINGVRQYVEAVSGGQDTRQLEGWGGSVTGTTKVSNLFKQFEDGFEELLKRFTLIPPEADPETIHEATLWVDWVKKLEWEKGGAPKFKPNVWPPQIPIPHNDVADSDQGTWRRILAANGWNTQGPVSVPPG